MREKLSLALVGVLAATFVATLAPARAAELPRIAIHGCRAKLRMCWR
jgi:hypothetical protein